MYGIDDSSVVQNNTYISVT